MVKVIFKLSEVGCVELNIQQPASLRSILDKCVERTGIELGGYIAVKDGRVVTAENLIENDDVVEVFPAISGG